MSKLQTQILAAQKRLRAADNTSPMSNVKFATALAKNLGGGGQVKTSGIMVYLFWPAWDSVDFSGLKNAVLSVIGHSGSVEEEVSSVTGMQNGTKFHLVTCEEFNLTIYAVDHSGCLSINMD